MKVHPNFVGLLFAVSLSFLSCGGNNRPQQNSELEERTQQLEEDSSSPENKVRTFTTNAGTQDYDKALNYAYTLGYQHGTWARANSMPSRCYEKDMANYKGLWTVLYGVPTSTSEAQEAYEACRERYIKGYDEAFYETN